MTPDFRNVVAGVQERHDYALSLNCGTFLRSEWAVAGIKAAGLSGGKVLEIGCGLGWSGNILAAQGLDVLSTDISEDAVAEARRRFPTHRFETADAASFVRPGEYDAITAFEVLEHIKDWEKAVANWKASLKPGGLLFLSTPHRHYVMDNPAKPVNPHHVREFFPEELRSVFPGCDLRGINLTVFREARWRSLPLRALFRTVAAICALFEDKTSYSIPGRENFNDREMMYHLMGKRLPSLSEGLWLAWKKPDR